MTVHFSSDIPDINEITNHRSRRVAAPPHAPSTVYSKGLKRVLDLSITLITLPLVLPLVGLMALIIALDGHNPFYSQLRVGRFGKSFRMWKLRSMVHNADAQLQSYLEQNPAARAEWDATQKLKKDPRITVVGRIIRKTSMDELPQLLNVLNGTMSLVGPRPMMLCQRDAYTGTSYYRLRPGITGLWQISDRNECDFIDRVRYDDQYEKTMSFTTDLGILLRTVSVVTKGTGY